MIYHVIISEAAEMDMKEIAGYISDELNSPQAALDLMYEIQRQILELRQMPKRFALVTNDELANRGIHLIPIKNYLVFYVVDEQTKTVNIVRIIYGRRDWISLLR